MCWPSLAEGLPLKLAIYDTGFCPETLALKPNIKIQKIVFATKEFKIDCSDKNSPRLHGHKVLETFVNNYSGKKIEIYPIVIFDKEGIQKIDYWENAETIVLKNKINKVLSASGVPLKDKVDVKLSSKVFYYLASGRIEPQLKDMLYLFPRDFLDKKSRTIVGVQTTFKESILKDPMTFKPEEVDVWEEDSKEKFSGSSYGVTAYTAKNLSISFP